MDTLAQPLAAVTARLEARGLRYTIVVTRPPRNYLAVNENCLYVIKQQIDREGTYHLVAAAKMRKEVL
ncbi:Hypothetical protein LUCI_3326 [Lucifera butyrica]|uniref:Uncharacterized protein n=1 Tax=Lucifera butyrica TaxID=1351585 RepID=A0A498R9K9_9FIRM|nr:hypothetical protein [Lucifera butyrica]VBB08061.1 Hypothetical protein LUCI_3326 [Lucifera butyrica]